MNVDWMCYTVTGSGQTASMARKPRHSTAQENGPTGPRNQTTQHNRKKCKAGQEDRNAPETKPHKEPPTKPPQQTDRSQRAPPPKPIGAQHPRPTPETRGRPSRHGGRQETHSTQGGAPPAPRELPRTSRPRRRRPAAGSHHTPIATSRTQENHPTSSTNPHPKTLRPHPNPHEP